MPPKKAAAKPTAVAAKVEVDAEREATRAAVRKAFIIGFHKAQQSTGSHATQRKIVLELLRSELEISLEVLCAVCVKTLSMLQSADVSKRHSFFLAEVCRSYVADSNNDLVPLRVMEAILPYHGAKEKNVRFSVCAVIEPLLRTLKQDVESDERSAFFDRVVEAMKHRAFDSYAAVRERAVAALATFQEGKKDCDVTQCLLAASCEDLNVAVRRQVIFGALGKEVYFGPMFRMTRDVAPIVRKTAWDSLAKAKFTHVVAFCQLLKQDFINLIHAGMHDSAHFVSLSVTAAISKWLLRDMQGDAVLMLSKLPLPATETPAIVAFALSLMKAVVKARDKNAEPVLFPLVVKGLTPANVAMWKACCEYWTEFTNANGGTVDAGLLPPLTEFNKVLRDAIDTFILQDRAECRVAVFVHFDHADFILRLLLSMFPLYADEGHLRACDDLSRGPIVKNLSSLLKVVTDTEPGLYAEATMRALRLIAESHDKAIIDATVQEVLQILFKTLALPRLYELGYDDVEMFGRKDQERRDELNTLNSTVGLSTAAEKRKAALADSIETDTLYLTRMMHVVHQYLSFCRRGDPVPSFCAHFIQLGRAQCDAAVRGLAVKALCMQCLMAPQTVHTFLPLVLADLYGTAGEAAALKSTPVTQAALCAVFDLLTEYPASFFEGGSGLSYAAATAAAAAMTVDGDITEAERVERRAAAEAAIAAEDVAKVGSARLLVAARRGLLAEDVTLRRIASRGFMKLLSCGRLPAAAAEEVIGLIMVTGFTFEALATTRHGQADVVGAFIFKQMDHFFLSYAGSDPRRMRQVADGGLLGARLIFTRQAQSTPQTPAVRLLRKLVLYTDAAVLASVREVDPDFVAGALHDHQQQDAAADGIMLADDGDDTKSTSGRRGPRLSTVSAASGGSSRLWTTLSRHSLHEYVAQELLLEIAHQRGNEGAQKACADELARLRFYSREPQRAAILKEYGAAALESVSNDHIASTLTEFLKAFDTVMSSQAPTRQADDDDADDDVRSAGPTSGRPSGALQQMQQQLNRREQVVSRVLQDIGFHVIAEGALAGRLSNGSASTSASYNRALKAHRAEGRTSANDGAAETPSEDMVNLLPPRKQVPRRR